MLLNLTFVRISIISGSLFTPYLIESRNNSELFTLKPLLYQHKYPSEDFPRMWNVDCTMDRAQKAERLINVERLPRSMGTLANSTNKAFLKCFTKTENCQRLEAFRSVDCAENKLYPRVMPTQWLSGNQSSRLHWLKSAPGHPAVFSLAPFTNCDIILLECMHCYKTLIRPCLKHGPAGAHYVSQENSADRSLCSNHQSMTHPQRKGLTEPQRYRNNSISEVKATRHICCHLFVCC